ncbi:hypothetical protein GmHk_02G003665 [Glycine max]|uniref:Uncharacterized protein n=1 Tax=Glycine max TaxID=3847 RepID=A0A0R0L0V2_SOYBN|nr:hypothetical protein GYH30_003334 [Glycine max]KAH1260569.1 hypothetical protein GmHk_02G003665 [Glycine max]
MYIQLYISTLFLKLKYSQYEDAVNVIIIPVHDSLVKPVTRILVGVALITFMITLVSRDTPDWLKKLNFSGVNFPPWILACVVIVFTRTRKRTRDFLKKRGW